ncbi:MAG: alpha-L-fucosidase [Clostridia bacterium]|nr:alpha-L-fucosidase [Clostridia bacterium]
MTSFADAKYGLFLHYGLYSLLQKHEWVQFNDKIPLNEYERLAQRFTAEKFDADYLVNLAVKAGMKYINITSCHHEGFCLWDSKIEPFNSVNTPCGRDLIKELSEACHKADLGFFTYYTFMLNWRHPYFVPHELLFCARPHYERPEPRYLYKNKEDFKIYIQYIEDIIDELLSNYKITGIWLDLIMAWYALGEDFIPIEEIYANIRKKHPSVLISWKQGATGTEDFASPEDSFRSLEQTARQMFGDAGAARAVAGFEGNRHKHNEVCASIQKGTWGYNPTAENRRAEELYQLLGHAAENNCNLLLNAGLRPDGSVDPEHERILLEIGGRITGDRYPISSKSQSSLSPPPEPPRHSSQFA